MAFAKRGDLLPGAGTLYQARRLLQGTVTLPGAETLYQARRLLQGTVTLARCVSLLPAAVTFLYSGGRLIPEFLKCIFLFV